MPPPMASSASQTITTVVFGVTATVISIVTVWYSYRAFKIWHDRGEVENTDLGSGEGCDWPNKLTNVI